MGYRKTHPLADQVFAVHYRPHPVVVVVQRWSGYAKGDRLLVSRNGQVVTDRVMSPERVAAELERARDALAGVTVEEAFARTVLAAEAGVEPVGCEGCGLLLPVVAPACPGCGLSVGQETSGRMSGAARRGYIHLDMRRDTTA